MLEDDKSGVSTKALKVANLDEWAGALRAP